MAPFHLIYINDTIRAAVDNFADVYNDENDCITFREPASDAVVDDFIRDNQSLFMQPLCSVEHSRGTQHLYSVDPNLNIDKINPDDPAAFAKQGHSLISVGEEGAKVLVNMDPRHEILMLFRSDVSKPWSIARTGLIPESKYIEELLSHPPVLGLISQLGVEAQLGIHTYVKDGQQTKILMRYYKFNNPDRVMVVPMYSIRPDGTIDRGFVPEDFFIDEFRPETKLHATHATYGELKSVTHPSDINDYLEFVNGQSHFTVYKTKKTAVNKNIDGRFLQTDASGNIVKTDNNETAIHKKTINWIIKQYHVNRTTLSPTNLRPYTASENAWKETQRKHDLKCIKKIEKVSQGVRVGFEDGSHILDTGNRLTLHGDAQDIYLEVMVLHAKECWGGKFHIERGSAKTKRQLWIIGTAQGLHVTGYTPDNGDHDLAARLAQNYAAKEPARPGTPVPAPFAEVPRRAA